MTVGFDFDFGHWAFLARTDPDAFERLRLECLEAVINAAPEPQRRRLRGLQFRIDMERRRSRTALAACIRISQMMWASVNDELVPLLSQASVGTARRSKRLPAAPARILPFRPDRNV